MRVSWYLISGGDRKINKNLIAFVLCSFFFMIPAQAAVINLTVNMDCAQANAGDGTCDAGGTGTGVGVMTFDTVTNLLNWEVSHSGLSSAVTAAHFHGPALSNQIADIQVGIGTLNPAVDSADISSGQAADLLAGLWYINIHNDAFPSGEIRGQVSVLPAPVTIDIKPGSDPNSINPRSNGVIPVAILSTNIADGGAIDFDATQVKFSTVTFGPKGAVESHGQGHVEDVDGDGDADMVFHFKTQKTGILCGDTDATLVGETFDGFQFTGTDTVRTVGCNGSRGAGAMSWLFLLGLSVLGLWRRKG